MALTRDEIQRRLDKHLIPGVAIGVCDPSSVRWSAGFGTTRAGGGEPITADTMFSVQSCSKMYTATAVLLAVQRGLVELDVPITQYLPEFRVNSTFEEHPERLITLRHLLSHTAGFTHEAPVGSNYLVGRESFQAHCESIADTWLRFPVGDHDQYSNLGIDLAGYILQRISGTPFHEFVRRELLAPLGMKQTTFDSREIMRAPGRAIGHSAGHARLPVRVPMVAAGGLYTSVNDAIRYIQLHLNDGAGLIDPTLLSEMYGAPDTDEGYGLGLALAHAGGIPVRGHGGGGFGFLSDMYWAPHAGLGVVVLTNSTDHPLQFELAGEILQDLIPDHPARSTPTPAKSGDDALPKPQPAKPDGPWNRDYVVRASGVRVGTARPRKENGQLYFDHWHGETVRLREHVPGLYLSSTGEMLDLTRTPPTYANIRLHRTTSSEQ
ncbi:serine hydrolase domain-containing protein [Kribbella sp. NPDC051586]|uniref:serine hydrolase domain-containing protein n=1 Tax=Kribbella sp. NPDC051586 TaxID=3364118 RepID=UPI0037B6ED26